MVKIEGNLYECEWCGERITWNKFQHTILANTNIQPGHWKSGHSGRHTGVPTLVCPNPKCGRNVSQRKSNGSK